MSISVSPEHKNLPPGFDVHQSGLILPSGTEAPTPKRLGATLITKAIPVASLIAPLPKGVATPILILDKDVAPLPKPDKLIRPAGADPFEKLTLGGLRRSIEHYRQRRPERKLVKAVHEQQFYTSLANTAFVRAGVKIPKSVGEVIVYNPDKPYIPAKGYMHRRQEKKVNYNSARLKKENETYSQMQEATVNLNKIIARKPEYDKISKPTAKARLKLTKQKYKNGSITKAEYEDLQKSIPRQKEARHHYNRSKAHIKTEDKRARLINMILKTTETGFNARGRKKDIAKWEKKVQNAPEKAQKRLEKMERKVKRKEKYKRGAKKVGHGAKKAVVGTVKAPFYVGSKVKQTVEAIKNR